MRDEAKFGHAFQIDAYISKRKMYVNGCPHFNGINHAGRGTIILTAGKELCAVPFTMLCSAIQT